jgi:FkbM family methyltransferase
MKETKIMTTSFYGQHLAKAVLYFENLLHPRIFYVFLYIVWPFIRHSSKYISTAYGTIQMQFNLLDAAERQGFLRTYDQPLVHLINRFCKPGQTFVDIGSNIGIIAAEAALKAGKTGCVILVEPNPLLYSRLQSLVNNNPLQNMCLIPDAVGINKSTLPFYVYDSSLTSSHTFSSLLPNKNRQSHIKTIDVNVVTLADIFAQIPHSNKVNFLQIDAEGLDESIILQGIPDILNRNVDIIVLETSEEQPLELLQAYRTYGYKAYGIDANTFELRPWGSIPSANRNLVLISEALSVSI